MRPTQSRRLLVRVALLATLVLPRLASAQTPVLDSWFRNTTGQTGYGGQEANVQRVQASSSFAYVSCSGIPAYAIGPWPGNPNTVTDQNFVFKFPRVPVANAGPLTDTPLGPTGAWVNGVVVFNAKDAFSYNNQNIWHQDAVVVEAPSFDSCLGHPPPSGAYHHHQNPRCLYRVVPGEHSPLLGFGFDGHPIYGPFGHANPDGSGGVTRMRSGYRHRAITDRTTLPDGTILSPAQYGPPVSPTYPLGYYIEDNEFVPGLGDLDEQNGRFTVTPEYPAGTYAYFTTINADGSSAYPYAIGPQYHGVVAMENISQRGHVIITEAVTDVAPAPGPGAPPDDLRVSKDAAGGLRLAWSQGCSVGAVEHAIYEGAIGAWYGHVPLDCHDDGGDLAEIVSPGGGDRYFLVVPRTFFGHEGAFGWSSEDVEIPRASSSCAPFDEDADCR